MLDFPFRASPKCCKYVYVNSFLPCRATPEFFACGIFCFDLWFKWLYIRSEFTGNFFKERTKFQKSLSFAKTVLRETQAKMKLKLEIFLKCLIAKIVEITRNNPQKTTHITIQKSIWEKNNICHKPLLSSKYDRECIE